MQSKSHKFLPAVQGLRAVAVLAVLVFHAWPSALPGGFVGVDIFFVISGFLITGILFRELQSTGRIDFATFYARRLRRLLPAALLVTLCTFLYAYFTYSPLEIKRFASTVIAALLYASNFWFAHQALDYLAVDQSTDPLLHTWSLAVEEQFYLFWPLFLVFVFRMYRFGPRSRGVQMAVASVLIVGFCACLIMTSAEKSSAFFLTPFRMWEFAAGALVALTPRNRIGTPLLSASQWVGAVLLAASCAIYSTATTFPGVAASLPVFGAFLVLLSITSGGAGLITRILTSKLFVLIGDRSYSLYLWHWPILVFLQDELGERSVVAVVLGVALSLLLSEITFRLIENRLRVRGGSATRVKASFTVGAVTTLAGTASVVFVRLLSIGGAGNSDQLRFYAAINDIPAIYRLGCHANFDVTAINECRFGPDRFSKTIVLLGDSHAAQWFPALERISLENGWRLFSFTKSACPGVAFEPFDENRGRQYVECTTWRKNALKRISEIKPDVVVLGNSGRYSLSKGVGSAQEREIWRRAATTILHELESVAGAVVFVRDTPRAGFDVPTHLARAYWHGNGQEASVGFVARQPMSDVVHEAELLATATRRRVTIIDMNDVICPSLFCRVERDGIILYSDSHHLTATFVRAVAPELFRRLSVLNDDDGRVGASGISRP